MNELALFAGAGGGILGGKLLGWRTVCAVEWEPYPASVLCARQNDGLLPTFPVWDDVQTFDGRPWRGIVDVVSGGFPCQDISAAGKGAGIDGERSGMWGEMARIIHEVRPRFVFVENSPMLTSRGLGRVLGDLASMGFDAKWGVLGARNVGGVHLRERIWIAATNDRSKRGQRVIKKALQKFTPFPWGKDIRSIEDLRNRSDLPEPLIRRINHDVAFGVDRLKAIGNGQVPLCAATAWKLLTEK
jgi:DNA (cytosine-5)-methyltransferase 1